MTARSLNGGHLTTSRTLGPVSVHAPGSWQPFDAEQGHSTGHELLRTRAPGADEAAFLRYEANLPMPSGEDVTFRYEVLVLDLSNGDQVSLTVVAPVDEFEAEGLDSVLSTVEVDER